MNPITLGDDNDPAPECCCTRLLRPIRLVQPHSNLVRLIVHGPPLCGNRPLRGVPINRATGEPAPAAMLLDIKGIGPEFAVVLHAEGLFRHFANRRQLAAYAGLAPSPWKSGSIDREQGVSKAGNPRLRTTMIQLAWLWLRHQPDSRLTCWFHDRVMPNGGRFRKVAVVALARKLLIALWKYATAGVVIEGALLKHV